jgi:hypothetical protein
MNPERPWRWLLGLLASDLRIDHGREMEQVFHEERREASARGPAEVMRGARFRRARRTHRRRRRVARR